MTGWPLLAVIVIFTATGVVATVLTWLAWLSEHLGDAEANW